MLLTLAASSSTARASCRIRSARLSPPPTGDGSPDPPSALLLPSSPVVLRGLGKRGDWES